MLRYLSLFSGIGAFEKALTDLGIDYKLVGFSEIDKYAIKSYCAIHGVSESLNLGDITKIDEAKVPDCDLLTYGFPCQDISVCGKQRGINTNTRSGLLFEALRIIRAKQPKYLIAENVKNLLSEKFKPDFLNLISELTFYGYKNFYAVLNAKDFKIPQNRERVFIVSIRDDIKQYYIFPHGEKSDIRLKDMLEAEVDEKYYISEEKTRKLIEQIKDKPYHSQDYSYSIDTNYFKDPSQSDLTNSKRQTVCVPVLAPDMISKQQNGRRFKDDGEPMFTLTGQDRHGVLVADEQISFDEVAGCSLRTRNYRGQPQQLEVRNDNLSNTVTSVQKDSCICIGRVDIEGHDYLKRVYSEEGLSPTIPTCCGGNHQPKTMINLRIRRLTPKECFRLMGFTDSDFDKAKGAGNSDTQLYRQAGNSIVVTVAKSIMKNLLLSNDSSFFMR